MEQASEVGTLRQPLLDRVKEQYNEIFLVGRHLAELFCTSTDAMWAVCLGHRGKDGNSAYWQGEQTGKQETNTKNNPQNTKKKNKNKHNNQAGTLWKAPALPAKIHNSFLKSRSHTHIRRSTSLPPHTHTSAHLYRTCTSTLSLLHIRPLFLSVHTSFLLIFYI